MATININSSTTGHRYYDIKKINLSFYEVYVAVYGLNSIKRELIYYDCVKEKDIK